MFYAECIDIPGVHIFSKKSNFFKDREKVLKIREKFGGFGCGGRGIVIQ